jgi:hypothetical protein
MAARDGTFRTAYESRDGTYKKGDRLLEGDKYIFRAVN